MKRGISQFEVMEYRLTHPCATLEGIGTEFKVGKERIRQILSAHKLATRGIRMPKSICSCGKPNYTKRRFCSRKCQINYNTIPLVCSQCEILFNRKRYIIMKSMKDPRYTTKLQFCSQECKGVYAGNNYGFKAHPENRRYIKKRELTPEEKEHHKLVMKMSWEMGRAFAQKRDKIFMETLKEKENVY